MRGASENSKPTQCLPLYSLLLALNQTRVDYFSLDVEGAELKVLKTIPFNKLDIQVLTVEFLHDSEGSQAIKDFLAERGYAFVMKVTHERFLANDFVFIKVA